MSEKPVANHDPRRDSGTDAPAGAAAAPGPVDHGGKGGMATREVAPDVAEPDSPEPPD